MSLAKPPAVLRYQRGLRALKAALNAMKVGEEEMGHRLGCQALLDHFGPELTGGMRNKLRRHAGVRALRPKGEDPRDK